MNEIPAEIKQLTFEQAYQQLDEVVRNLEDGQLPLDEALALYQRGMALAQHCGLQLDNAELTIKELTSDGDLVPYEEV
jgi:exodeoxyribonuclease VII small subunit